MHGTTAAVLQDLFVAATNYEYCVVSIWVSAYYVGVPSWTQQPGRFQATLPLNFNETRGVQQRYSSSSSSGATSASLTYRIRRCIRHPPLYTTLPDYIPPGRLKSKFPKHPPDLWPGYVVCVVYHPPCGVMPNNHYDTPKIPPAGWCRDVSKHAVPTGVPAYHSVRYLLGVWQPNSFPSTIITPII